MVPQAVGRSWVDPSMWEEPAAGTSEKWPWTGIGTVPPPSWSCAWPP